MYEVTIFDLHDILFDEQRCFEYLRDRGIFYASRVCSDCMTEMSYLVSKRIFRCPKAHFRKEIGIRKNSFFEGLRLPMNKTMLTAFLWIKKTPPAVAVSMTGLSEHTIVDMYRYFRELVSSCVQEEGDVIGGDGVVVEIDESKLGKRKFHRGHHVDGVWVLGGVERTTQRRAFMVAVNDRSSETLQREILAHVAQGSIVHTDLWRGYFSLASLGYTHCTVNHSLFFKDPITGIHTNTIEGTWCGLKINIAPRNRGWDGIEERLNEFIWRRQNSEALWDGLVNAMKDMHFTG
jgi:hypothetical protein